MDLTPYVHCPPAVRIRAVDSAGLLLARIQHERDRSWHAVVVWINRAGDRHEKKIVTLPADQVESLEPPAAYRQVPRWRLTTDGKMQPWEYPPPMRRSADYSTTRRR